MASSPPGASRPAAGDLADIRPGSVVAIGDGASAPVELFAAVSHRAAEVGGVTLILGWSLTPLAGLDPRAFARVLALMGGYSNAPWLDAGAAHYLPARFGTLPSLLTDVLKPDVLVAAVVERPDGFHFTTDVSWQRIVVEAGAVVVASQRLGPSADAGPAIPLRQLRVIASGHEPLPRPATPTTVDSARQRAAELVRGLIPEGGRVQYAPGVLGDLVMDALTVPVYVDTGVITPAAQRLDRRGLVLGNPVAPYSMGDAELMHWLAAKRCLVGVEVTHDARRLADGPPLIAVNTALQIDRLGQVNVERLRGRVVAGIGGQPDYMAAAASSRRGLSIVALASSIRGVPTLVESIDGAVSTPSHDVDVVVTENGAVHLRGLDRAERETALSRLWGR